MLPFELIVEITLQSNTFDVDAPDSVPQYIAIQSELEGRSMFNHDTVIFVGPSSLSKIDGNAIRVSLPSTENSPIYSWCYVRDIIRAKMGILIYNLLDVIHLGKSQE